MENIIDNRIVKVTDLLEQIESVNNMIKIHENDQTNIMKSQYQFRRNKFLKELNEILKDFNIGISDLAA